MTNEYKPTVLLAVDRPGWAFHNIASVIADYFKNEFNFKIVIGNEYRNQSADIAICLKWNVLPPLLRNNNINKVVCCLYDHVTWCKSADDQYIFEEYAIKQSDYIAVSNMLIWDMLRNRRLDRKPVFLIEDGVNTNLFNIKPLPEMFVLGWCGNAGHGHGTIKGLNLIKEACKKTGTELLIANTDIGNKVIKHTDMPAWYSRISAYVCASSEEGTPNPPLEAMACGRPVISTRIGIMDRLIVHGVNGYFCERSTESIAHYIEKLKRQDIPTMGAIARSAALAHDWKYKLTYWKIVLDTVKAAL